MHHQGEINDMKTLCKWISLDGEWTIEGMEYDEGLGRSAYKPNYVSQDPVRAEVPTIVQNALLQAGKIEDPYWEMNNEKILWIEDKEWWYFKEFTVPEDVEGKTYELVFEGITYRADIWLDGITIGKTEGMFKRVFIDITRFVKPGEKHLLTLRCRALEHSSEDRPGGKVKRGMVRSSGVVAPFTYWWNWSPHMVPIGIWKSVWLNISGGVTIRDPFVKTTINWDECVEAESVDLTITVDVASKLERKENLVIKGTIKGVGFNDGVIELKEELTLEPGDEGVYEIQATINRPRLWWPNGMGEHPLYKLELEIYDSEWNLLDATATEFGVREITMIQNTDAEWVQRVSTQSNRLWSLVGNPYPWTFVVNKKRMFVRGSNWLPLDNLFRFPEERYRQFLDQVEASNLNLLRIWGGGIQETETFYKLCDQKGILCWTEFWLSCANYPVMPYDLFIECALDMIKTIRNHPSIAIWSGGNEYNPDAPENKEMVDRLGKVCEIYDSFRPFRRGSPYKGDRHGGLLMLPTRTSNKYNGDILNGPQRLTLLRSEIAVGRSAPNIESIKRFIGEDKLWPIDRQSWQYHHAVIKEQERDAKEYGGTDNLEYWVMSTQIGHGQIHRHNMEYCRQTKYWCSGCMQWQINASWPTFHRELIDWYGIPKPSYYAYKRSSQDYLVLADFEKYTFDGNEELKIDIYAVNDRHLRVGDCTVKAVVYDSHMNVMHEQEDRVVLEADVSTKSMTLNWKVPADYLKRVFFVYLELRHWDNLIAENLYWLGTTGYARPAKVLNLNGPWQYQIGQEINETKWQKTLMPSYWALPPQAPMDENDSVFYRRKIVIPEDWKGTKLELFCAGFEGNDEVWINGVKIGETEEELTVEMGTDDLLFTEKWAERMVSEQGKEVKPDKKVQTAKDGSNRRNIRISSDPFITPNLIKRFYPIPQDAIRWGKINTIEVRLYGEHATGVSEPVYIREVSTKEQQQAVIDFDNEGAYLAEIRQLPEVDLDVQVYCDDTLLDGKDSQAYMLLHVENNTIDLAFFTEFKVEGLDDEVIILFSDNYTHILPNTEKDIHVRIINLGKFTGTKTVKVSIGGWNAKKKTLEKEFTLLFK